MSAAPGLGESAVDKIDADVIYGEIIGADFRERTDGRIVMHVAVDEDVRVGRQHVTIVRDPHAVVMTSKEAALDRAHWWNQGAAMERRREARPSALDEAQQ